MSERTARMKKKAIRLYAYALAIEEAEHVASKYEKQLDQLAVDRRASKDQNVRLREQAANREAWLLRMGNLTSRR